MQAKNIALFILCFCLAGGVVNGSGIFQPVAVPDANTEQFNDSHLADGIMKLPDNGTISADDISTGLDGWGMLINTFGMVGMMFQVLVLPGFFLSSIGVPSSFAWAIQIIVNVVTVWGLVQFVTGRSTKTMD